MPVVCEGRCAGVWLCRRLVGIAACPMPHRGYRVPPVRRVEARVPFVLHGFRGPTTCRGGRVMVGRLVCGRGVVWMGLEGVAAPVPRHGYRIGVRHDPVSSTGVRAWREFVSDLIYATIPVAGHGALTSILSPRRGSGLTARHLKRAVQTLRRPHPSYNHATPARGSLPRPRHGVIPNRSTKQGQSNCVSGSAANTASAQSRTIAGVPLGNPHGRRSLWRLEGGQD